jgi:hypothetical protein
MSSAQRTLSFLFLQRPFCRNCTRSSPSTPSTWLHPRSIPTNPPITKARFWQTPQFGFTFKMSSAGIGAGLGSAGLYAVVTNPASIGAVPEDYEEKRHHLKNGKGFVNPWDSFRDFNPAKIMLTMIWYVSRSSWGTYVCMERIKK